MMRHTSLTEFRELVDTDPLFAAEGTDLEYARDALGRLKAGLFELEDVMAGKNFLLRVFFIRYPLWKYAIPITFLGTFLDAEQARRDFLARPEDKTAAHLLRAWRSAQHALLEDIHRYQFLHRVAYRTEKQPHGGFQDLFGNTCTVEYVDATLQLIEKNAHALKEEIQRFENVLEGSGVPKRIKAHGCRRLPPITAGSLLPWQEHLHRLVVEHTVPFRGTRIVECYGPIYCAVSFLDGKPTKRLFFVYVLQSRASGRRFFHASLADEFYFLPLGRRTHDRIGSALWEPLIKAGIPYWYHPVAYWYVTRDVAYMADLATMVDLQRRPHLRSDLLEKQRSSLFDLLLSSCVEDLHNYCEQTAVRVHMAGKPMPYSFLYGILFRSHPAFFYLPFNGSVWRLPEQPNFLGTGRIRPEELLYRPSAEVLPRVSEKEIEAIFSAGRSRREAWLREGIPGVRREQEF